MSQLLYVETESYSYFFEAEVRYALLKGIDGITLTKFARKLIDSLDSEHD